MMFREEREFVWDEFYGFTRKELTEKLNMFFGGCKEGEKGKHEVAIGI